MTTFYLEDNVYQAVQLDNRLKLEMCVKSVTHSVLLVLKLKSIVLVVMKESIYFKEFV